MIHIIHMVTLTAYPKGKENMICIIITRQNCLAWGIKLLPRHYKTQQPTRQGEGEKIGSRSSKFTL
jgi:hypothetical protein